MGLALLTGVSGTGVVLSSRALAVRGVTPAQVNGIRFHAAWLISGVIVLLGGRAAVPHGSHLAVIAVLAITLGAAPLIVLQYGMARAEPLSTELILSTLPGLVFAIESVRTRRTDPLVAVLMAALISASAAATALEARTARRRDPALAPAAAAVAD